MAGKPDHVRAVARALNILKFVNKTGATKIGAIAEALDIPRPSVYRLVATLEDEGYVRFSSTDSRVRVTARAAALGDNAQSRSLICHVAGPVLIEFTREHSWPIDLTVYEDGHMVIEETTHARSALSVDPGMSGYKLPMLRTSAGRAYLGACTVSERAHIVALIRNRDHADDRPFLVPDRLDELVNFVGRHGFAVRGPETFRRKTSSLAVPIICGEAVLGCVSTIWVSGALTMDEAIALYAGPLNRTADTISRRMAQPEH